MVEKLLKFKEKNNLTTKGLASLLGYDIATVSRWLNNKKQIGKQAREIIKLKLNIY